MSFWGKLKRRNVFKVGVAYAIIAWLIAFFALAFETPNGIKRSRQVQQVK